MTHEFAYGQDKPATRNAWDHDCYPGGSSAGSGVAVAAGTAFGAIGTDTGGSIRVPASVNGVVGLKPTFGRVSTRGVFPMSPTLDSVGSDRQHGPRRRHDARRGGRTGRDRPDGRREAARWTSRSPTTLAGP